MACPPFCLIDYGSGNPPMGQRFRLKSSFNTSGYPYQSDGISDTGVFRPANGNWYLDTTKTGAGTRTFHFGTTGDVPLVGVWQITN